MKKLLLIATSALLAFTASAQLIVQDEAIENNELGQVAAAPAINADAKPAPGYIVPTGTFFSSYAKACYRLNNPILHVPAFTDLTFVNASTDATSYLWKYVNPEGEYNMFNPQLQSTEIDLTVKYSYADITMIEAPVLTATNELGDSATSIGTNTPVYMRVGGGSTECTNAAAEGTYYGWSNTSPLGGTLYYSSARFATNNTNSGSAWAKNANLATASVRGFGEVYFKPAKSYALTGFAAHVREIASITSPVTLTIYKVTTNANGYLASIDEVLCTQTLETEAFEEAGTSRLYLAFNQLVDAKTGKVTEGYTIDFPILVTLTLPEDDTTSQMGAYYNAITVNIPVHNYVILNGADANGNETKGLFYPAGLNYTNKTYARSFSCFSLMGTFEYLIDENEGTETDYEVAAEGGNKDIALKSSKAYKDALGLITNWTATQADGTALPEWVDVVVTDNYETVEGEDVYQFTSTAKVVAAANTVTEERTCDLKLAFLGAEYLIHVTQAGATTGIEDVVAAQDDANAPVYNVMGQRVGANAKGLLIRGGKKIYVK
ncbi:MAG: hypothetical protein IJ808_07905 [Muribaculaceae bacterium]|nr:hypothetical protein [Muribaculaceae bacterium]